MHRHIDTFSSSLAHLAFCRPARRWLDVLYAAQTYCYGRGRRLRCLQQPRENNKWWKWNKRKHSTTCQKVATTTKTDKNWHVIPVSSANTHTHTFSKQQIPPLPLPYKQPTSHMYFSESVYDCNAIYCVWRTCFIIFTIMAWKCKNTWSSFSRNISWHQTHLVTFLVCEK